MKKSQKKLNKKIFDALGEKEEPKGKPGILIPTKPVLNRKDRRHYGRRTPKIHQKGNLNEIREMAIEPQEEYDDWFDYRDGMRDTTDTTKILPATFRGYFGLTAEDINERNKKLKKQEEIKKLKRRKKKMFKNDTNLPY